MSCCGWLMPPCLGRDDEFPKSATSIGRCLGSRSNDGDVITVFAIKTLAFLSASAFSAICIVLDGRVVFDVTVAIGMYNILSTCP